MEEWKTIKDYPYYQVSNKGNVRSIDRTLIDKLGRCVHRKGKLLKFDDYDRYYMVRLYNTTESKNKSLLVHRLVAETFIPNPDNLPQVNHKDENTYNNCVDNLEWCTQEYNCNYGTFNERMRLSKLGSKNPMYGKEPANKNKPMSEEQKKKLSLSHLGKNKGRHWKLVDGKRVWFD